MDKPSHKPAQDADVIVPPRGSRFALPLSPLHLLVIAAALVAAWFAPAFAKDAAAPQVAKGQQVFLRQCAPCHGQGPGDDGAARLPGTNALQAKYKGEVPAALEQRKDLEAAIIRLFVRNGSGPMPMFRKAELSDADIDAIAAYLKASAAAKPAR